MPENTVTTEDTNATTSVSKQRRLRQAACPLLTLKEALNIPQALKDNFAGQPTPPLLVAEACGISPSSSNWRTLTGAAEAYGLTLGGYNAKTIALSDLGERIVSPLKEGDDNLALKEAELKPRILSTFYAQYDNNKLPKSNIGQNILLKMGVPNDRLELTWEILRDNATETNMLRIISGNEYIFLENKPMSLEPSATNNADEKDGDLTLSQDDEADDIDIPIDVFDRMNIAPKVEELVVLKKKEKPNIFISHGKNSVIVGQLKELLAYGQMEPIVSVEREATAISVPDKVFDDMRACDAGIINIDLEETTTANGENYSKLNENVLIEIGAAIALYGKKVILLCQKGTALPSNMQGLYRCEYEGKQLDYNSTIKLLKTMQELRNMM
jgi:predicted nucleotide-binding protein